MTAQFGGEVGEAVQVLLDLLEFAQRLLLAPAMLEHTGGLFDEAAPVLGAGVQDRVEAPLANDHVHLAADT